MEPRSEHSTHSNSEDPDPVVAVAVAVVLAAAAAAAVAAVNFAEEGGRTKENFDAPVGV